jgi:lysophospholipase L1-like esterase
MNKIFILKRHGSKCRMSLKAFLGIAAFAALAPSAIYAAVVVPTKFDFGTGAAAPGYTKVMPTTMYSATVGYGFQPSKSPVTAVSRGGSDPLLGDYCTSVDSFSFSLNLPLGNYTVNVYLGDLNGTSITSVYGEQRRLFLDRITTASGQTITKSFTINRRDYKNGSVTISRTDRELTYSDFDNVLNLTFSGSKIAVCGIDVTPAAAVTTIYVCGNSTSVDQPDEPFCSWPQMITRMFNQQVSIADYAESGLTASSFLGEHRLDMIGTVIKAGDYVLAEFGHNDQKNATDIANYCANLKQYSDFAIAHNATPIFVTPTARKTENDSTTSVGGMAQKARDCAKTNTIKVIELNAGVIALHKSIGTANVASLYATGDATHFSDYGSFELARVVAKCIVGLNLDIAKYLTTDLPLFNPAKPDPLNYLTTPTPIGTVVQGSESLKQTNDAHGLSVDMAAHVVRFDPGQTGAAVFSLYSMSGKLVAEKRAIFDKAQGSMAWQELSKLAEGVYVANMNIGGVTMGKSIVCKF